MEGLVAKLQFRYEDDSCVDEETDARGDVAKDESDDDGGCTYGK